MTERTKTVLGVIALEIGWLSLISGWIYYMITPDRFVYPEYVLPARILTALYGLFCTGKRWWKLLWRYM